MAMTSLPIGSGYAATDNVRINIVGGGVAGTRAAAYLKLSVPQSIVTLFDPGLKQGGEVNFYAIQNKYIPVSKDYLVGLGVEIKTNKVRTVEPDEKQIELDNGEVYKSDILVISPGIDFKWDVVSQTITGNLKNFIHAWKHPSNEVDLWRQIELMRNGDSVVISVPEAPFRFRQGPYIRATKIADYLKTYKPKSKAIIMDSNDSFPRKNLYLKKWEERFSGNTLSWIPASSGGVLEQINLEKNIVYSSGEELKAGVINYIPPQQAGSVARQAKLNFQNDWCQVSYDTMESLLFKQVYVIGDANNADILDKSAEVADQHALKCVASIQASLV